MYTDIHRFAKVCIMNMTKGCEMPPPGYKVGGPKGMGRFAWEDLGRQRSPGLSSGTFLWPQTWIRQISAFTSGPVPCAPRSLFMMQIAMIGRRQVLKLCCYPVSIASSNDFVKSQQAAAWKVELPAAYRWGLGPVRYRRSAHEEASCKAVWLLDRFPLWNFYIWNVSNMDSIWLICHEHS